METAVPFVTVLQRCLPRYPMITIRRFLHHLLRDTGTRSGSYSKFEVRCGLMLVFLHSARGVRGMALCSLAVTLKSALHSDVEVYAASDLGDIDINHSLQGRTESDVFHGNADAAHRLPTALFSLTVTRPIRRLRMALFSLNLVDYLIGVLLLRGCCGRDKMRPVQFVCPRSSPPH